MVAFVFVWLLTFIPKILDEVAKIIEKQVVLKHSNQTVVVADLVSESITIGTMTNVKEPNSTAHRPNRTHYLRTEIT